MRISRTRIGYFCSSISTLSRNIRPFVTALPYVTQPSMSGPGGAALRAEELLVDVGVVALAPVGARDDGEAGADAARALGQAVAGPGVRDRALGRDDQPLAHVRGGHRARVREARDADDAVLAQLDLHAAEGAGVVRDVRVDRVEDPGHAVVHRARARLVEPGGQAVDVVGQVDLDHARVGIDRDRHVDRDPVRRRAERIVAAAAHDRALAACCEITCAMRRSE